MQIHNLFCFKQAPLLFLLAFNILLTVKAEAFTNIQTSTSIGTYKDYQKNQHYPLYHSWSIKGIYSSGIETSVEFYLNNDFAVNEWSFFPTQAYLSFPAFTGESNGSHYQSEVKLGRQLYTEGFDLALLDGAQVALRWSADGGIMPIMGYLKPTDFSEPDTEQTPLVGLVLWENFADIHVRTGLTARDKDLSTQFFFGALQTQFPDLLWQPSIFMKGEWLAEEMSFNQSSYELTSHFSETIDGRLAYTNLDPRPINAIDNSFFVYKLFAVSPTETVMADLTWSHSEDLIVSLGAENAMYNSGFQDEVASRVDFSLNMQLARGRWLTPSLTYMKSYGGELKDFGLRYTSDLSHLSKFMTELNWAYMSKINQIEGWAQNLRSSFETHFWDRAKLGFAVEVERNQYYIFDTRAQIYVTNYL